MKQVLKSSKDRAMQVFVFDEAEKGVKSGQKS